MREKVHALAQDTDTDMKTDDVKAVKDKTKAKTVQRENLDNPTAESPNTNDAHSTSSNNSSRSSSCIFPGRTIACDKPSHGPYGPITRITLPLALKTTFPLRYGSTSTLKSTWKEEKTSEALQKVLGTCSIVVGMHADQATEAIVDFGLLTGRPIAVVPCCVFPNLFSRRWLVRSQGATENKKLIPVRKYNEFCEYLLAKSPKLRSERLDFEGRNLVIYLPANATKTQEPSAVDSNKAAPSMNRKCEADSGNGVLKTIVCKPCDE